MIKSYRIENPFTQSNVSIPPSIMGDLVNSIEIFYIDLPEINELTCYLNLMLLNEGILVEASVIQMICDKFKNDIRKIILFLQVWAKNYQHLVTTSTDNGSFMFYRLDSSFFSPYFDVQNDCVENWRPFPMPNILESADYTLNTLSQIDHKYMAPVSF